MGPKFGSGLKHFETNPPDMLAMRHGMIMSSLAGSNKGLEASPSMSSISKRSKANADKPPMTPT